MVIFFDWDTYHCQRLLETYSMRTFLKQSNFFFLLNTLIKIQPSAQWVGDLVTTFLPSSPSDRASTHLSIYKCVSVFCTLTSKRSYDMKWYISMWYRPYMHINRTDLWASCIYYVSWVKPADWRSFCLRFQCSTINSSTDYHRYVPRWLQAGICPLFYDPSCNQVSQPP